jgi:hypothetical protein
LDLLVDSFKKKIDQLKNVSGQNKVDNKKLSDILMNIQRLFSEIKKIQEIEENPKFISLYNEISTMV